LSYLLSIDQSLAKCAYVFWKGGEVALKGVIRTGSSSAKTKTKGVEYFDTVDEQIDFICRSIEKDLLKYERDYVGHQLTEVPIVFEGLSFGSVGDATRNLAGLYFVMRNHFSYSGLSTFENMHTIAPTSLKAFARDYLPDDQRFTSGGKKVKMDKKLMVTACLNVAGDDFLDGYNMSTGKDDLADAFLLGLQWLEENSESLVKD